jgi:hypothetical protein
MPRAMTQLPRRRGRTGPLSLALLTVPLVAAGCGGGHRHMPAATTTRTTSSAPRTGPLAFADCMRANGVPNFPDPAPSGGFEIQASGVNPTSPAFKAAQARCQGRMPSRGFPAPGEATHPARQTLAKLLRIARCMRRHGISQFPDPLTRRPSRLNLGEYDEITDYDDAILLFPRSIDMRSSVYRHDLAACGAPPLGLPH